MCIAFSAVPVAELVYIATKKLGNLAFGGEL